MATKNRDKKDSKDLSENGSANGSNGNGKAGKNGFMTYEEVNDQMPADVVSDQMDDVMGVLGDEDIEIVDAATQVKIAPKRIVEEEAADKKNVVRDRDKDEDDSYYSKSNDPVRMYLRKMGSVSLLTREGEVEIAKRIEQGEHMILGAILNSPVAVREIIDLGDKLRKHKIRVKEIIRDAEDEEREFDEEKADRDILRLIDKVKHLDKVAQDLHASLETCAASRKKGIESDIEANKTKMVETLEEMRLNKKTIDKIVMKLRSLIQKVERAEGGVTELEKRTGVDMDQLRKEARTARADARLERLFRKKHGVAPDEVLANHSAAQKNLRRVEEELNLDVTALRQTYADIREGEAWLVGASISEYAQAGGHGHQTDRDRKLLLHRGEIDALYGKVREKGLTLVPTRMSFKDGRGKGEIALARGRERVDKRRVVAARDAQRDIERALKRRR